ncbi:hypothetical protein [Paraburkholderia fungorum]|uniref:Antitoxin VbhA domain-containing protein n=1 Tax=Paraburkholderia fungorum TaxID=134537 RepID=A0AAW3V3I5_9BURK|nr:hypothetical protein [Paraburkholderia fungorum]MBB4517277.1 hypothetical protein [Paraburkholderia fungorum]MBB6204345.1 hypothetical protein [Paraburkholderia fungorum]
MPRNIRSEAKNVMAGYVSTHPDLEPELTDDEQWREDAAVELKARKLGVVKALSEDVLQAIVAGEIDMSDVYAAARSN